MEVKLSTSLCQLYKESKKNMDQALSLLLDSMDPECYMKVFEQICLVESIQDNKRTKVSLGDSVSKQIYEAFDKEAINDNLINELLWIAALFPEI